MNDLALQGRPAEFRPPPRVEDHLNAILALATVLFKGGMTSKTMNRPEHIAARIIAGREVGLSPVQAVNWIMIVNGRAVIWGDAALALVRASGRLDSIVETIEGEGDARTALCTTRRKGDAEGRTTAFGVADAKRAGLWDKPGPWQEYPDRQLMWRARSWNLRDQFGDVLNGLGIVEEELDVPVRVVSATADPPAALPAPRDDEIAEGDARDAAAPPCGSEVVGEEVLARIAAARPSWLRSKGIDPADAAAAKWAWVVKLGEYGVTSARKLSPEEGAELMAEIEYAGHQQELTEVFTEAGPGG